MVITRVRDNTLQVALQGKKLLSLASDKAGKRDINQYSSREVDPHASIQSYDS